MRREAEKHDAAAREGAPGGLAGAVMRRLDELAEFSSDPEALTRLFATPEHAAAAELVLAWMRGAGLDAAMDDAGNVVGRREGAAGAGGPALLLGSHIDTVRNAGRYDGALGVVLAIQAMRELHARGERLPFAVEVVGFGDEEGVRFPVTLLGSKALAGTIEPAALDAADAEGVTVREALRRLGRDPAGIGRLARRRGDLLGYVEVHIEQGPLLEAADLPVGVVTAINGATRFVVEVEGVAGHSGTVPMGLRADALTAAAEMVLLVERVALETPDLVGTVGSIAAKPGAVNVIPSGARFTIDVRGPCDETRRAGVSRLLDGMEAIARRRGVSVRAVETYDQDAAACAPFLVSQMESAVARCGVRPRRLASGAGHDGLAMAALCPIGMLFLRCPGGISHNPRESVAAGDVDTALRVLLDFLRHFRPEPN